MHVPVADPRPTWSELGRGRTRVVEERERATVRLVVDRPLVALKYALYWELP